MVFFMAKGKLISDFFVLLRLKHRPHVPSTLFALSDLFYFSVIIYDDGDKKTFLSSFLNFVKFGVLSGLHGSKAVNVFAWFKSQLGPLCLECACSSRPCVGFLQELQFPPTVQKLASWVNWCP